MKIKITPTARKIAKKSFCFLMLVIMGLIAAPKISIAQTERFQSLGLKLDPWAEAQISFWKDIYTKYSTHDYVIHDSVNGGHVYGVASSEKNASQLKVKIRSLLLGIAAHAKAKGIVEENSLNEDERPLFQVLERNSDPSAYLYAADPARLRTQLGQKDRLEDAFSTSRHFLSRMEEMLVEEGVPKELSRLPFVESGFNQDARSHVGATGIWQFMPKTALRDLRVDSAIDERYDPLKATRAAAKFLKRNELTLKNWGLAIMAYHQGPGLVMKAVNKLNTHDPFEIIRVFKNPNFLFASRNYLFEFLAMSDVDAHQKLFFKKREERELPKFITVSFPQKTLIKTILAHYHAGEAQTKLLNPHFRDPIWTGRASIPAHYPVRLTGISLEEFRHLEYPKDQ